MEKKFLSADLHLGHTNIIYHCRRPFKTKAEHDKTIIKNWNDTVSHQDHVYICGDVCFDGYEEEHMRELNGFKHIILGNHDKPKRWVRLLGIPECKVVRVTDVLMLKYNGCHIWLSHYAHRSWKNSSHGSYHAFGHSHGNLPAMGLSMDVGVDCHGFKPITLEYFMDTLDKIRLDQYKEEDKNWAIVQKEPV